VKGGVLKLIISGIGTFTKMDLDGGGIQSVKMTASSTFAHSYYQDGNPENTFAPYFARALRDQQQEALLAKKRLDELRASEEYRMFTKYPAQPNVARIVENFH